MIAEPFTSTDFGYLETDIPAGLTIREWRARRSAERAAQRAAERGIGARAARARVLLGRLVRRLGRARRRASRPQPGPSVERRVAA